MEYITSGDSYEAKQWLNTLKITEAEKQKIKNFIRRFPNMIFYKRLCSDKDPNWMQSCGEIFMGVYSVMPAYHFSHMDSVEYPEEWERQKFEEHYFIFEDAFYEVPEFPGACGVYEKIMLEETKLLIIASYLDEDEMEYLAIKKREKELEHNDSPKSELGVYRFRYSDVKEGKVSTEEGFLEIADVQLVFPSFYELFNRVTRIRLHDEIIEAKSVKCN